MARRYPGFARVLVLLVALLASARAQTNETTDIPLKVRLSTFPCGSVNNYSFVSRNCLCRGVLCIRMYAGVIAVDGRLVRTNAAQDFAL